MAPEVAAAFFKKADKIYCDYKKANIFSAGVVIYEMIFDSKPFTVDDLKEEKEEGILPSERVREDEMEVLKVVKEMLRGKAIKRCDARIAKQIFVSQVSTLYVLSLSENVNMVYV